MLEDVQIRLGATRESVGALQALVSETNLPVVPPLPSAHENLHPEGDATLDPVRSDGPGILQIDVSNTPLDVDTDMEEESDDNEQWQTVKTRPNKKKDLFF